MENDINTEKIVHRKREKKKKNEEEEATYKISHLCSLREREDAKWLNGGEKK
jgi:hypothetical protein